MYIWLFLSLILSSCMPQMEEVESVRIAGSWAVVDENDMTSKYFVFKTGYMSEYKSVNAYYFHDGVIWGATPSSFDNANIYKYSLEDGVLHYNYHDKDISSDLELKDGVLMFGNYRCLSLEDINASCYSEILLSETNKTVFSPGEEIEWNYEIANPVQGQELIVIEAPEWCGGVSGVMVSDGKIRFSVIMNDSELSGKFVFSYISAQEVAVEVKLTPPRLILDEISCVLKSGATVGSFGYMIENALDGVRLEVGSDVDWITVTDDDGTRISYHVTENNTGSPRSGKIVLSYSGLKCDYVVSQIFSRAYEAWLGEWTFTGSNGITRNVTFLPGKPDSTFRMTGYEGLPEDISITVDWDEASQTWEISNQIISEDFVQLARKGDLWILGAEFSYLSSVYEPGIPICTCGVSDDGTFVAIPYEGEIQGQYHWYYYKVGYMRLALQEADGGSINITDINGNYPNFPFTVSSAGADR